MDLIYDYSSYTLEELKRIEDRILQNILITEYHAVFLSTYENSFLKQLMNPYYGLSLDSVFKKLECIKNSFTSLSLFPGDFVKFYPWCSTRKSKKFF